MDSTHRLSRLRKSAAVIAFLVTGGIQIRTSYAGGLRTRFGEVLIKNLKIGQTYSLKELINFPLTVVNTGGESVALKVSVIPTVKGTLKKGFEPAPTSWITLAKSEFADVRPNHEAVTDIRVSIPNDPKLMGRRFQADIWTRSQSRRAMFLTGIDSRLLIAVSSDPPTPDELKKKYVNRRLANLDFTLFPANGKADGVPVGVSYDLEKERGIAVKIVNPNDAPLHFRIRSVPNWEAGLYVPRGYQEAPSALWVKPKDELLTVPANSIKKTGLVIDVPKYSWNYGGAYFFPIAVEILEQDIPARAYYTLTVRTEKDKGKPKGK